MPRCALFLLIFVLISLPTGSKAATLDAQNYRRAFMALDSGHPEQVSVFLHGHDPILNKVLRSYYMTRPGNDVSFGEMASFVDTNPNWPDLKGILAIAEQKIPTNASSAQVIDWFTAHPPAMLLSFYRYIDALNAVGQTQDVPGLIRSRWAEGEFSAEELTVFQSRFSRYLDAETVWARLDHLLWKNDVAGAKRMFPYADEGMKAVAEARLALAGQSRYAEDYLARVPSEWQSDSGLLYERLRWSVRKNHDEEAVDILRHPPERLGKPEAWWEQRQIEVRRAMDHHNYDLAYRLAAEHGQTDGKTLIQGEFLAGWLALRFLNSPEDARTHFQALFENASTPISRARGAYWLGRTFEVLGAKASAEQAYETAAALNITYYGQLATTRLYAEPIIQAAPEPAIPAHVRAAFFDHDLIRAVERLHDIGETDRTHTFFHAAIEAAQQRSDFALLTELAYKIQRPDYAIEAAKAANQKNMLMASGGFPMLGNSLPKEPEPAFTYALIRQESMFNPAAESPAGAEGLMQLLPSTARDVARKIGVNFKPKKLADPDYNLRLGAAFVQKQIDAFDGSYVLALAGYNAGPRRVREWMTAIGDPRNPDVDPVDWVEMIPVPETRNYVQRIIESLQVYRARLNGGQARLMILKDLKR